MKDETKRRFSRFAGLYDALEWPVKNRVAGVRKKLVRQAEGKTLEVGIGTGNNIPFYPGNVELTGIDISEKIIGIARNKSKERPNVHLMVMDAENMLFEDNSFDTVVSFGTLCSIPDPERGLKEIRRVCKDRGRILMIEHVRSNNKVAGRMLDVINPLTRKILGESMNRRTYEDLLKAGFKPDDIDIENVWTDIIKFFYITNNKQEP